MTAASSTPPTDEDVAGWVRDRFDEVGEVLPIGAGAWSRAYGFTTSAPGVAPRELVVRVGPHVDDFRADEAAGAFDAPDLPVPRTVLVEPGPGGWCSVTTRCRGDFLEELDAAGWRRVWPAVAAALRQLWSHDVADLPAATAQRFAAGRSWRTHLLAVDDDPEGGRLPGARRALARRPEADAAFRDGLTVLSELAGTDAVRAVDDAPRVLHSDLVNRNVMVDGDRLTGVFDWGCAIVGDPLYDLAWLDVWGPWHPGLAALGVRDVASPLVRGLGLTDEEVDLRWRACALHILVGHLVYSAGTGDDVALEQVRRRTLEML